MTCVQSDMKMQECGLPMMSLETSGSVAYSMIPLSGPSAAAFIAALTSSLVTSRLKSDGQVGDRCRRAPGRAGR